MMSAAPPRPVLPPLVQDKIALEQSFKAREVEGALDLCFYRPLGLRLARLCARLRLTPAHVTLLGTALGVLAGHFYYYSALSLTLLGMTLHVLANLLDNVDGQLARLTKTQSDSGKILDGIGDHVVFVSVYFHLCLRFVHGGGSPWIWLLALAAGFCHSMQSAAAEFCRDAYARFASGRATRLPTASELRAQLQQRPSLFLALHANYVRMQESALPQLANLRTRALQAFDGTTPAWFGEAYRATHTHFARSSRLLGTNTRMLLLFGLLLLRQPAWYFVIELTVFNALLGWLALRENRASAQLLRLLSTRAAD